MCVTRAAAEKELIARVRTSFTCNGEYAETHAVHDVIPTTEHTFFVFTAHRGIENHRPHSIVAIVHI